MKRRQTTIEAFREFRDAWLVFRREMLLFFLGTRKGRIGLVIFLLGLILIWVFVPA